MKRVGFFYLLFIIPSCANSNITSVVNREDRLYKIETINTILEVIRTDFLDWEINDYIVAKEAISFRQYEYLLEERLKDKIEFEPLSIEEIRNPQTEPFDNDLSSNKESKFHLVFSTIWQDFYTVEVFEWYEGRGKDFEIFGFHQGESLLFLFKFKGENKKPQLIDKVAIHNN